ncbi:MAG: methyltransferase family protein [Candidatus Dormibacteria bacterium]
MNLTLATSRLTTRGAGVRLLVFGRVLPATFFAILGYIQMARLLRMIRDPGETVTPSFVLSKPLPALLYLLFCAIPVFIYVARPPARARDPRLLPRAAGLVGTVMLLVAGAVPQVLPLYRPPRWFGGLSTAISVAAFTLAVWGLLHLRRNLSLMPEARRLVTGGPYEFVRHPLYSAEILAAVAFALVNPYLIVALTVLPFIGVQILRSGYEEALLADVFPAYRAYASRTRRLIPLLW